MNHQRPMRLFRCSMLISHSYLKSNIKKGLSLKKKMEFLPFEEFVYLSNFGVYASSDVSPKPQLNDVNIMPNIANHSVWAAATIARPTADSKQTTVIRILESKQQRQNKNY